MRVLTLDLSRLVLLHVFVSVASPVGTQQSPIHHNMIHNLSCEKPDIFTGSLVD